MSARYQVLLAGAAAIFFALLMLFPAVATFRQWLAQGRGFQALVLVVLFVGTLSVALGYAWMKGDLSWARDREDGNSRKQVS